MGYQDNLNIDLGRDRHGNPVQALPPDMDVGGNQGFSDSSAAVSLAGSNYVRVYADQDCYLAFGTSGVSATSSDLFHATGTELYAVPDGDTHLAVIRVGSNGTLNWRKMGK